MMRLEPRRQRTDSILESSNTALRLQLEKQILDVLRHKSELDTDFESTLLKRQVTEPVHGGASSCAPQKKEQHASSGIPQFLSASRFNFSRKSTPNSEPESEGAIISATMPQAPLQSGPSSQQYARVCRATEHAVQQSNLDNGPLHGLQEPDTEKGYPEDPDNAACGGLSGCTTAMIRNIPSGYTQRKLKREIDRAGFFGRYDFFYLPMDARSPMNRGFAFVNFTSEAAAAEFYNKFHGTQLTHIKSDKAIIVLRADIQGLEANVTRHLAAGNTQKRKPQRKPIFFQQFADAVKNAQGVNSNEKQAGTVTQKTNMAPMPTNRPCPGHTNSEPGWERSSKVPDFDVSVSEAAMFGMPPPAHKKDVFVANFCGMCGHTRCRVHLFCPNCGGKY